MMSKKHFVELANLIKLRPHCFSAPAISALADWCASENPRFQRQRWLDYIDGKCGPNGGQIDKVPRLADELGAPQVAQSDAPKPWEGWK